VPDWMQTFTGKAFYPMEPRSVDVDPVDIAHALSLICRFGGHSKHFYSVAEHCVLISQWVEREAGPEEALWGLLHDATEAYVGDMVRPLKNSMPDYRLAEAKVMTAICAHFWIPRTQPQIVHEADSRILLNEKNAVMGRAPASWAVDDLEPLPGIYPVGWDPKPAEFAYLERFHTLEKARA
jgi:hypothetical protein